MSRWWPFAAKQRVIVDPGRQSVDEEDLSGVIGRLSGFYNYAAAPFRFEVLQVLELLGQYNPDMSQALKIWADLGNTGHEIEVEARNPEAVLDRVNALAASIYHTGGGVDGLVNHFFRQLPLMGALSGEWVVADRVQDGVTDVAIVPVKTVRWQRVEGEWRPYQYTARAGDNGYVALNPFTYSYMPLQTREGSPYALPLFLPALKNVEAQLDMTGNIGSIVRKMGLLGFLDVSLEVPQQKPQETDQAYLLRLKNRLKEYAAAFKANMSKGVAVHYKDQELKHTAVSPGAAAGAKSVFDLNEEQIFSALDIPPSLAGRSYSTTETYATVDWDRLQTKLGNGRRTVKRFLEKGYTLDLLLRGIDAQVSVSFNAPTGLKAKEEAETEKVRIENVLAKRDGGIIDDDQAARELGYEAATGERQGPGTGDRGPGNFLRFTFNRLRNRYEHVREVITLETPADDRTDQNYMTALQAALIDPEEKAIAAAIRKGEELSGSRITAANWAGRVFEQFAVTLRKEIAGTSVSRIVSGFVSASWRRWRYEDKNHLRAGRGRRSLAGDKIDIALVDRNALSYLVNVDNFYLGRGNYLVREEGVGKQFINWLQEEYIAKGLNIRDASTWDAFRKEFPKFVRETSAKKIEDIVSTSIARAQNMGQTMSLYEAGFARYTIVGPSTPPICDHCKAMLGRTFEVKVAATRLAKILENGFEKPENLPPFLSSRYSDPKKVKAMSDAELQAAGFETPPYHPRCRHRKAAAD